MSKIRRDKERLIKSLIWEGVLKSSQCIEAFKRVPREKFVWPGFEDEAYIDTPLPLGDTAQTISAPHMAAYLIEELDLKPGQIVFEIGTGSGYQAALIAECIAPTGLDRRYWGHVYTIEINEVLVEFARRNLIETGYGDRVTVIRGDGSRGWPPELESELYDRIVITAAAPRIPTPLIKQLKKNGILLSPVGRGFLQDLVKIYKASDGSIYETILLKCAFVPLRGKYGF